MSFLAPLFLLGGTLLALPLLFHLIRRQPRSSIQFSSLLFLQPSPPQLSRRSRIDNWLLLLLRGLALALIVIAFSRPFFRATSQTGTAGATEYRVVVLDQTASMRREDLWTRALAEVQRAVADLDARDRVALVGFAAEPTIIRGFDSDAGASPSQIASLLNTLEPSWEGGDLGAALSVAAELLRGAGEDEPGIRYTIALVSDLQRGNATDSLQEFSWPEEVLVRLFPVSAQEPTNASLAVLPGDPGTAANDDGEAYRVAVTNAEESRGGSFQLRWVDPRSEPLDTVDSVTATVPPGTRRVVRMPAPPEQATAIELLGDDHPFDNRHFVAAPRRETITLPFFGSQAEDPSADLFYFLQRVTSVHANAELEFRRMPGGRDAPAAGAPRENNADSEDTEDSWQQAPLVFLHEAPPAERLEQIRRYVQQGGKTVVVIDSKTADAMAHQAALNVLIPTSGIELESADVEDYSLLANIDFQHPVFDSLADPRFNDFSKIQIWRRSRLQFANLEDWRVLATFDDGSPAMTVTQLGRGEVYLLGFGWQPTESELALSSKFVPLIAGLIGPQSLRQASPQHVLGSPLEIPPDATTLEGPGGESVTLADGDPAPRLQQPGIYRWLGGASPNRFAANIPLDESQTTPLEATLLEQLGVVLTDTRRERAEVALQRQMRDMELERQQQWWQVLLAIALGLLLLETLLAARRRPLREPSAEPQSAESILRPGPQAN
jgi:hypothetical protein